MDHDTVDALRRHHAAWALLRADNAALVISFLDRVFIEGNARAVARGALVDLLDDHLFALRERIGADAYPRNPLDYLPHAQSVLMDRATLLAHRDHWGVETTPATRRLERLTVEELSLYDDLVAGVHGDRVRLEQERVRFGTAARALEAAAGDRT